MLIDIIFFDEKVKSLLVEITQDRDGDEFGILKLSKELSEYNTITGRNLSKIGKLL